MSLTTRGYALRLLFIQNMHLISIIIPVYKAEKYIRKCLDSILAQTYTNWEAILVDDGSPDNCGAICDEYAQKDERFKVIHQENRGVVNARNKALSVAKGDFLGFVDSDDYIEPTMYEEMLALAIKDSADIVWCDVCAIFKDSTITENFHISQDNEKNIKDLLAEKFSAYLCNKFIRKTFWDKCNIKTDEASVIYEDTYITFQLLINNPVNSVINRPFYNYIRTNEEAATSDKRSSIVLKAEQNIIHIYEDLLANNLLETYYNEFSHLALELKIELLKYDVDKAINTLPRCHKYLKNFKFSFWVSLFYWFAFNSGFLGKQIFKVYFNLKKISHTFSRENRF